MSLQQLLHSSLILIDKPRGPTSFDVVERISNILGVRKAGHTGTLDPNATGLLVIALGEARKAMPVFTQMNKEYAGTMKVHCDADEKTVEDALLSFKDVITQIPPVKSAVARRPRKRKVYEIEVLQKLGRDVKFRVLCEAGTYIRKIAHDAGEKVGCGAHLTQLRRTMVGPFAVEHAVTPEKLEKMHGSALEDLLIPLEDALGRLGLPGLSISKQAEAHVRNGAPVSADFVTGMSGKPEPGKNVGVYDGNGKIICLAVYTGGKRTAAKTDRVFM